MLDPCSSTYVVDPRSNSAPTRTITSTPQNKLPRFRSYNRLFLRRSERCAMMLWCFDLGARRLVRSLAACCALRGALHSSASLSPSAAVCFPCSRCPLAACCPSPIGAGDEREPRGSMRPTPHNAVHHSHNDPSAHSEPHTPMTQRGGREWKLHGSGSHRSRAATSANSNGTAAEEECAGWLTRVERDDVCLPHADSPAGQGLGSLSTRPHDS